MALDILPRDPVYLNIVQSSTITFTNFKQFDLDIWQSTKVKLFHEEYISSTGYSFVHNECSCLAAIYQVIIFQLVDLLLLTK